MRNGSTPASAIRLRLGASPECRGQKHRAVINTASAVTLNEPKSLIPNANPARAPESAAQRQARVSACQCKNANTDKTVKGARLKSLDAVADDHATMGVPTKIVLARRMIERAVAAGVPAAWAAADAAYGSDYRFRESLEDLGPGYVVGVRSDFSVCSGLWQVRARRYLCSAGAE